MRFRLIIAAGLLTASTLGFTKPNEHLPLGKGTIGLVGLICRTPEGEEVVLPYFRRSTVVSNSYTQQDYIDDQIAFERCMNTLEKNEQWAAIDNSDQGEYSALPSARYKVDSLRRLIENQACYPSN